LVQISQQGKRGLINIFVDFHLKKSFKGNESNLKQVVQGQFLLNRIFLWSNDQLLNRVVEQFY
jgi:hypothetical protein